MSGNGRRMGKLQEQEIKLRNLEMQLGKLDAERISMLKQIHILREDMATESENNIPLLGRPLGLKSLLTNPEKVNLFLQLFKAREEIYPKRWENSKTGKSGYSPVCHNEWNREFCKKPTIKCADCSYQKFSRLDESAVESHLKGQNVIGTYAIRSDDTCIFLACDFDEASWQLDVQTYRETGRTLGIEVAVERSRSGNGAHAWIFFENPVSAKLARSLGTLILAKCSERNLRLSLESYDRFFPSQDFLPKGGFGNLIALPLQKLARESGNSSFIDETFGCYSDQWTYLNGVKRLSLSEVRQLLNEYLPKNGFNPDGFEDVAWLTDNSILAKTSSTNKSEPSLTGETIEISFGSMLSIPIEKLPARVVAKLKKTSSFANPEFYKKQRMRMQTYPLSRFIFSGEIRANEIVLPRGVLDDAIKILTVAGAKVVIRDERIARKKLKVEFSGTLSESQVNAVSLLKKNDIGILMAPPGAGKTVMACALMAERKVSTLILVHRQPLMEQWRERIETFLGFSKKEIGNLSGAKKKMTGKLDLAMLQSLSKIEDLTEIAQSYSQIIIDECHHIPAASFEDILKQLPARFVVGLTATPYRKDGLEKILFQQCGPIRHEFDDIDANNLQKNVTIHETGFRLSAEVGHHPAYHELIQLLTSNEARNKKIIGHTLNAISEGRFPLLISDRKEHLDTLEKLVGEKVSAEELKIIRLDGDLSNKQRRVAMMNLHELRNANCQVLLMSSASLIGEGFDLPALDTLILATPLSFEGRMIQYAGRIHRKSEGKTDVRMIDYLDSSVAMLVKMHRNRLKAYKQMGYAVSSSSSLPLLNLTN